MVKVKNRSVAKRWELLPGAPDSFLGRFLEYPAPIAALLYNRGLTDDEAISRFLEPEYPRDLHDPFALTDMREAVQTIREAIAAGERIVVHGDYDADGLTATALLTDILKRLGADVTPFVPSRYVEGYGLAAETLERLHGDGAALVVSVDCGISSAAEIAAARKRGLKVVVTDHHTPPATIPTAEAVVNPKRPGDAYPNKDLAGVGVAFKLAQALLAESGLEEREREAAEKWSLDLVALGTVADLVPLLGENRTLVKFGLTVLGRARRPGIKALLAAADLDPVRCDSTTIGYTLAPRLNAAGRLGDAGAALEVLTTDSAATAATAAAKLSELNAKRQEVTMAAVEEARERLGELTDDDRIIVLDGEWLSGVVGLVAGRLTQEFNRPAVVIERGTDLARGSARSIAAFNIVEALAEHKSLLTTYGGHAGAAGFSLAPERLTEFRTALVSFAAQRLGPADLEAVLTLDAELAPADLTFELTDRLAEFEPFGIGNPKPQFALRGVMVSTVRTVGSDQQHLKLTLDPGNGQSIPAIAFGDGELAATFPAGSVVDVAGRPTTNTFRNVKTLEWHVTDIRPHE